MKQRVPARWWAGARNPARPRVLIEDSHPALAISDFSQFQQAGFEVAYCSGPEGGQRECPLLCGADCPVASGADAVLHNLSPALGVAAAIRRRYPQVAVVAAQRRQADGRTEQVPGGCLPLSSPSSVPGQVEALRQALTQDP